MIINLEVFKINRYQAPFIKSPCPTNVMTGCNIASVVELSSTGEVVESQTVTIPSPFPEIMYCPDLYQKNLNIIKESKLGGGGRDGVRGQVRKPQKEKMSNKRYAAETLIKICFLCHYHISKETSLFIQYWYSKVEYLNLSRIVFKCGNNSAI